MTSAHQARRGLCRRFSACLPFVLAPLLAAQPAHPAGKDSRERDAARAAEKEGKERAAKTACLAGDAAKGVALLAELYVSSNDPIYLFNQGRCFEQNGKYAEAIVRFREYQRKNKQAGNVTDEEADRHIAECQAFLDRDKAPAPQPVAPPSAPVPQPASPNNPPPLPPTVAKQPQTEILQPAPGSGLRAAGIAGMAVGVAGVAIGVVLNLRANSLADEVESSPTSYDRSKVSTRSSYETLAWVSYGLGATCLVGGAVLYYLGQRQSTARSASSVALRPAVGPGQLGAVLEGAF
jgi:hypothetical protein